MFCTLLYFIMKNQCGYRKQEKGAGSRNTCWVDTEQPSQVIPQDGSDFFPIPLFVS